ncbi:MAG: hypothetical protein OK452_10775 [Thaumarchaeota archaeon]|nr:hypothetical protein [Nitrososphaerota archaeon]
MLSSYDLAAGVLIGATILGYGYVTYAALAIRRTIAGGVYRKQALGLALVAVLYALNATTSYYSSLTLDIYSLLGFLSFPLAFVMIFYWVDKSALAARLTDPLLRDTLHWSKVRYLIWTINISAVIISFAYTVYIGQLVLGSLSTNPPLFLLVIFLSPAYLSVSSGAVVLFVAVRRTADRTLKKHLEWFGFYLVFIFVLGGLVGNGLSIYSVEWSNLFGGAANAAGAFFLYKSAKSLIHIYSFSDEEANRFRTVAPSAVPVSDRA